MSEVMPPHEVDTSRRTQLILSSTILTGAGILVVTLRMIARGFVLRSVGSDDWMMLVALIPLIAYLTLILVGLQYGQGLHVYDWELEWFDPGFKLILAVQAVYYVCVYTVKVSILLFYLRLAAVPRFRQLVWGTIILLTVFLLVCIIVVFTQCTPLSEFWDLSIPQAEKNCINTTALFYSTSVFNIITDVWILLLPVRLLWRIQRPAYQKIMLLGVFIVGTFACIASCIRLYTIQIFTYSDDPLFDSVPINIWSFIEINVGIICASVPALKAFFVDPSSLSSSIQNSYNKSGGSGAYGNSSKNGGSSHIHSLSNGGGRNAYALGNLTAGTKANITSSAIAGKAGSSEERMVGGMEEGIGYHTEVEFSVHHGGKTVRL